jgi:hypothetical protein
MANVILTCDKSYYDAETVCSEPYFLNIEEDFYGADLVTFTCPKCNEVHKSNIYGR